MKRAIITSALPYANGEIHLGHVASTYLPADITTRFLRSNGVDAYYFCASDDFGTPILIQSEKEGKTPAEYARYWNERDRRDFEALNIRFDRFHMTSSQENTSFVQETFRVLNDAGHIYKKEIIQPYCRNDKKFLPDRYVRGTCPHCKAQDQYSDLCESCGRIPEEIVDPKCAICGMPPTKEKTEHYFFKLAGFGDELGRWLEENQHLQRDVKKYVQNWIKQGLTDWDVTRDISWGVQVPLADAQDKVFYGWFDNHLAYISTALEFFKENGIDGKEFWNSAEIYHFIGKDIVYHHYLFLPAMRLGIGRKFKLPDHIPTRGHLTLGSKKISKSRNWYISLKEFLGHYRADYLRYYLAAITPYSQDDLNFDWGDFEIRINSELIGNLGNFVNRSLGFTVRSFKGIVPAAGPLDQKDLQARQEIGSLAGDVKALMEQNHLDRALKKIMGFSSYFNQYFQHKEPWKMDQGAANCIYLSVNAVKSLSVALWPFLPDSAGMMQEQLGIDEGFQWSGMSELTIQAGHRIGSVSPLFSKVDSKDIESLKEHLGQAR